MTNKFDFTKYTDKLLILKYYLLLAVLWLTILLMYLSGMKMFYLVFVAVLVTISALTLLSQRLKTGFRDKFKSFEVLEDSIVFRFSKQKDDQTHSLSKIKKIYIKEMARRGKKLDPYHFFLVFEFSQKKTLESIEIPTLKILCFLDDFKTFNELNNLDLKISNTDKIKELLGNDLYEYLLELKGKAN